MTPLIKLKILINNKTAIGLYDSGANISLINYNFWKKQNLNKNVSGDKNIETISGISKAEGKITLSVKIYNITKQFSFFIIKSDSFRDDVLLGLDCIKEFKLCQDENLKIWQKNNENIKQVKENSEASIKVINSINSDNSWENLMTKYDTVFAKEKFDIGTVKKYKAMIKLTENKYIAKKPYRCSIQDKTEIESQIKQLLKAGLIEGSCSPYAAPVTLVYKKEEARKSRLCIDYRELNKIVVPESQPFPRIDDLTLRARNCKYFTKLDVNSAFWSIPLRNKTDTKQRS